jgi:hypothetical protein
VVYGEEGRWFTLCPDCGNKSFFPQLRLAIIAARNKRSCWDCGVIKRVKTTTKWTLEKLLEMDIYKVGNGYTIKFLCGHDKHYQHQGLNSIVDRYQRGCQECIRIQTAKSNELIHRKADEEWRVIAEYPKYEVSNLGRVRNDVKQILKPQFVSQLRYPAVMLYNQKGNKFQYIHRLVAKAFVPNPFNFKEVNHLNSNNKDNQVENLEWTTHRNNIKHAFGVRRKRK